MGPPKSPTSHPKIKRAAGANDPRAGRGPGGVCSKGVSSVSSAAGAAALLQRAVPEEARAWSRWKAQQRYRATRAGKQQRNGQSQRYRERVRNRKPPVGEAVPEAARVITKKFFRRLL